jgi:hypothetical protein
MCDADHKAIETHMLNMVSAGGVTQFIIMTSLDRVACTSSDASTYGFGQYPAQRGA